MADLDLLGNESQSTFQTFGFRGTEVITVDAVCLLAAKEYFKSSVSRFEQGA